MHSERKQMLLYFSRLTLPPPFYSIEPIVFKVDNRLTIGAVKLIIQTHANIPAYLLNITKAQDDADGYLPVFDNDEERIGYRDWDHKILNLHLKEFDLYETMGSLETQMSGRIPVSDPLVAKLMNEKLKMLLHWLPNDVGQIVLAYEVSKWRMLCDRAKQMIPGKKDFSWGVAKEYLSFDVKDPQPTAIKDVLTFFQEKFMRLRETLPLTIDIELEDLFLKSIKFSILDQLIIGVRIVLCICNQCKWERDSVIELQNFINQTAEDFKRVCLHNQFNFRSLLQSRFAALSILIRKYVKFYNSVELNYVGRELEDTCKKIVREKLAEAKELIPILPLNEALSEFIQLFVSAECATQQINIQMQVIKSNIAYTAKSYDSYKISTVASDLVAGLLEIFLDVKTIYPTDSITSMMKLFFDLKTNTSSKPIRCQEITPNYEYILSIDIALCIQVINRIKKPSVTGVLSHSLLRPPTPPPSESKNEKANVHARCCVIQ